MPGEGVVRRVILIKVCLAVLWLAACPQAPAGVGPDRGAADISQPHANAAPATAGQWSRPRTSRSNPADNLPHKSPDSSPPDHRNLWKFMAGGLLGALLWSIVFGYPLSLYWSQGTWPFGFLDLVAVTTAVYLGYRLLRPVNSRGEAGYFAGSGMSETLGPPVYTIKNEAGPGLAKFSHTDPAFNLAAFAESARQMIFDLHEAWNHEDLDRIKDRITEQMLESLRLGLRIISLRGEISRVEDLALSHIVVVMAQSRQDREVIGVSFQGRVVDYVLERRNFKLVSGSMTYPERLHECWIFERERGRSSWLLADIKDARGLLKSEAA